MPPTELPSPEQYNQFIEGLELTGVCFRKGQFSDSDCSPHDTQLHIKVTDRASYEPLEQGFEILHTYNLSFMNEEEEAGTIEATLSFKFKSSTPLNDGYFAIYKEVNLPNQSWPYFREFVQSAVGRMGWPPLVLPLMKFLAAQPEEAPSAKPSRKKKPNTSK